MRTTKLIAWVGAAILVVVVVIGLALWRYLDAQVDRRSIDAVTDQGTEQAPAGAEPVEFLVVGTDDRSGLSPEERAQHSTGQPTGPPRTDVLLLVQVRPSDDAAAVISIPRDLLVEHRGNQTKINSVVARGGRDGLVRTVEDLAGIQIDHYVEVSIPAFLKVVGAVGGVEVCLEGPLVDPDAGADLAAGCQELDAGEALAYVRSRAGPRGDFRRIERQQRFLRALVTELTSARTALDVPRLFRIADRVGGSLVTDEDLSLNDLRGLAEEIRNLANDEVDAATLPAYPVEGGLVTYAPGAANLFAALGRAEPLPDTGRARDRRDTSVAVWHDGSPAVAGHIESLLYFLGFDVRTTTAPVDAIGVEVFAGPDREEQATWVANVLGTELRPLPSDVELDGADVLVGVGGGGSGGGP